MLETKVFIISERSSLNDPITLEFVNAGGGYLADNSVETEIHKDETIDLDSLLRRVPIA
jgi:hypothetical protein